VINALETGSSQVSDFIYRQIRKDEAQETLIKAAADKSKALYLIAQTYGIAPGDQLKESFEKAVTALGKSPSAQSDLLALAKDAMRDGQYATAVFILDQSPSTTDETLLKARRSACAMYIADDLMKSEKTINDSPYQLVGKEEDLSKLLGAGYSPKEPDLKPGFPPMPHAIDLTSVFEGKPAPAVKKDDTDPVNFPGTDEKLKVSKTDATEELLKLSNKLSSEGGKIDDTRTKQAVLLIQFGNTLMDERKYSDAAAKFREAFYLYPRCAAARTKLNEALTMQKLDPKIAAVRFKLYKAIAESGKAEAAIAELFDYAHLADNGPAYALLGLSMLKENCQSTVGYRYLVDSFDKTWPAESDQLKASAHLVIARLLERDAEEAKNASQKERMMNDIQLASIEYRIAATLDSKNQEILDGLLENAKVGVRYANNPNNNMMLGGGYYLKGRKDLAKDAYGLALSQNPSDPGIKNAYDKYKALSTGPESEVTPLNPMTK
jgi:tetratricopeptide (TPR) repeat protein